MEEVTVLKDMATKLRIHSVKMTLASKSGHPTSCSSMAELMSVLFFKVMKYKDPKVTKEQRDPANDRFILSMAAGMAYCAKHFDKSSYRTYCLMGDGESMEG